MYPICWDDMVQAFQPFSGLGTIDFAVEQFDSTDDLSNPCSELSISSTPIDLTNPSSSLAAKANSIAPSIDI
jgi:hypothetical protein